MNAACTEKETKALLRELKKFTRQRDDLLAARAQLLLALELSRQTTGLAEAAKLHQQIKLSLVEAQFAACVDWHFLSAWLKAKAVPMATCQDLQAQLAPDVTLTPRAQLILLTALGDAQWRAAMPDAAANTWKQAQKNLKDKLNEIPDAEDAKKALEWRLKILPKEPAPPTKPALPDDELFKNAEKALADFDPGTADKLYLTLLARPPSPLSAPARVRHAECLLRQGLYEALTPLLAPMAKEELPPQWRQRADLIAASYTMDAQLDARQARSTLTPLTNATEATVAAKAHLRLAILDFWDKDAAAAQLHLQEYCRLQPKTDEPGFDLPNHALQILESYQSQTPLEVPYTKLIQQGDKTAAFAFHCAFYFGVCREIAASRLFLQRLSTGDLAKKASRPQEDLALIFQAELDRGTGDFKQASAKLAPFLPKGARDGSPCAPLALLMQLQLDAAAGTWQNSLPLAHVAFERFPQDRECLGAIARLGLMIAIAAQNPKEARFFQRWLIQKFPDNSLEAQSAGQAEARILELEQAQNDHKQKVQGS